MRIGIGLALFLVLCSMSCSTLFPPEETLAAKHASETPRLRKHILLLPFINRSPFSSEELVLRAKSDVESALSAVPDVVVVHADELGGAESLMYDDSHYDFTTIFERARARGIAGVVSGTIEEVLVHLGEASGLLQTREDRYEARVTLELHDAAQGKELFVESSRGVYLDSRVTLFDARVPAADDGENATEAVTKALESALVRVPNGLKRLGWFGRVVKIDGSRYYLNAGEETGLKPGELLKVFSESVPIEDAKTGIFIGMAPGRFKGVLRLVDFVGRDGSVAVLHSGAGVREQDQVQVLATTP